MQKPARTHRRTLPALSVAAAWVGVALSVPRLASAQSAEMVSARWQLDLVAPEPCPSEASARAAIRAMLTDSSESSSGSQHERSLAFRATVARAEGAAGDRWTLTLVTTRDDASDTRTLDDDRCGPLIDALSLIVAIAVDPTVASRIRTATPVTGGIAPTPVQRPAPPPERPRPARRSPVAPTPPVTAARRWTVGLGGAVDSGILPAPAWGALVWGAYGWPSFRTELVLGLWPERAASVPSRPSVGGAVSAYSARWLGCFRPQWALVSVAACAAIEGAVVRGRGTGVSNPGEALSPWLAAGLEARASLDVHPAFSLVVQGSANVLLTRPEFFLEGIGTFFQTPALSARAVLGAEVHF